MHEQTTNNKKKKRAKLGQNISKTLTYKHDLATNFNQLNVKAVSMPPKFFQQVLLLAKYLTNPSKVKGTKIRSTQKCIVTGHETFTVDYT